MREEHEYIGFALNGPARGETLRSHSKIILVSERRWWRRIFFPRYHAYHYTPAGWLFYE